MKKYRTRKEKFFRLAGMTLLLAALLSVTNAMNFLPGQAVRDIAETQNISEPQVIRSFYTNKIKVYRSARQYLVEGKEGLMLCAVGWDLLMGWYDRDWCAVNTAGDEPVYLGYRGHQQGEDYVAHAFGRVDDEKVARIVFRCRIGLEEIEYRTWEVPREAFFSENGRRYFLAETDAFNPKAQEDFSLHSMEALVYDENGALISEAEVRWHDWGSGD